MHTAPPLFVRLTVWSVVLLIIIGTAVAGPAGPARAEPAGTGTGTSVDDPLAGQPLYTSDRTFAANSVSSVGIGTSDSDPTIRALRFIARQPTVQWLDPATPDLTDYVRGYVSDAAEKNSLAVLAVYGIPHRDCSGWSAGGLRTTKAYHAYLRSVAAGFGGHRVGVVVEPDALAMMGQCLTPVQQLRRVALLRDAVRTLGAAGGIVYLDAGTPDWNSPQTMADRLRAAGVSQAAGFALNVSNFYTTADSEAFGQQVSRLLGGAHFVIDTSRNGNGRVAAQGTCNPPGRALGTLPTTDTGQAGVDAFLWVKYPGSSDGACDGSPPAGAWFPDYARMLFANSQYA